MNNKRGQFWNFSCLNSGFKFISHNKRIKHCPKVFWGRRASFMSDLNSLRIPVRDFQCCDLLEAACSHTFQGPGTTLQIVIEIGNSSTTATRVMYDIQEVEDKLVDARGSVIWCQAQKIFSKKRADSWNEPVIDRTRWWGRTFFQSKKKNVHIWNTC